MDQSSYPGACYFFTRRIRNLVPQKEIHHPLIDHMYQTIEVQELTMQLLPGRAVYIPQIASCIIADLHLGKTAHFRKHGIPIPDQVAMQDLEKLGKILIETQAQQLIIAGDFFHAARNSELQYFEQFREKHKLPMILVKGNHDRLATALYQEFDLQFCDEFRLSSEVVVRHEPSKNTDDFVICGHIHPGISMRGPARQQFRLPAFLLSEKELILPAFSFFTGLDTRYVTAAHCPFVIAGNQVIPA